MLNSIVLPLFLTACLNTSTDPWPETSLVLFTAAPGKENALPELRLWMSTATDDLITLGVQPVISTCCPKGFKCKIPSMVLYKNTSTPVKTWADPQKAYKRVGGEQLFHNVHKELEEEEGILRADFSQYQSHYIAAYLEREKFLIGVFPTKDLNKNLQEFRQWRKKREKLFPKEKMAYFYLPKGQSGSIIKWLFDIEAGVSGDKMYYFINKALGVRRGFKTLAEVSGI